MNKGTLFISIFICSSIGSWIPSLWGAGYFSVWGVAGGFLGAIIGVFVAAKINSSFEV